MALCEEGARLPAVPAHQEETRDLTDPAGQLLGGEHAPGKGRQRGEDIQNVCPWHPKARVHTPVTCHTPYALWDPLNPYSFFPPAVNQDPQWRV